MTIDDMRIFLTVSAEKSFVRSAKKLFMSQSAVSQRIRKTELELGFPLLERNKHTVRLTAPGEIMADTCAQIMQLYHSALQECRQFSRTTPILQIAYLGNCNSTILPELCIQFNQLYPDYEIITHKILPSEIPHYSSSTGIKLLIAPDYLVDNKIPHFIPLIRDQHYCVMNIGHVLSTKKEITYEDLRHCILLQPSTSPMPAHIARIFDTISARKIPCLINRGLNHSGYGIDDTVTQLLSSKKKLAIMPSYTAPTHPELCKVPFLSGIDLKIGIAYTDKLSKAEMDFINFVKQL